MFQDTYRHADPDTFHGSKLSLHDCIAERISSENGVLRFSLPEGFWITPHHEENPSGKTVRTDASIVSFSVEDIDDILLRVFTRHRGIFSCKTNVDIWDMDRLISAVNSGKCVLEFITQYRTYGEQMWHCAIRSSQKPYYRECQMYLPNAEAAFYWNQLRLDHEW